MASTWYRTDHGVYSFDATSTSGGLGLSNVRLRDGGTAHRINAIGIKPDTQEFMYLFDGTKSVVFGADSQPNLPVRSSKSKKWSSSEDQSKRFQTDKFIPIWPSPTLSKSEVSKVEPWMIEGTQYVSKEDGVTKVVAFRQTRNSLRYTFVVPIAEDRDYPTWAPVWTDDMLRSGCAPDFWLYDRGLSSFKPHLMETYLTTDPDSGVQTARYRVAPNIEDIGPQPSGLMASIDRLIV